LIQQHNSSLIEHAAWQSMQFEQAKRCRSNCGDDCHRSCAGPYDVGACAVSAAAVQAEGRVRAVVETSTAAFLRYYESKHCGGNNQLKQKRNSIFGR